MSNSYLFCDFKKTFREIDSIFFTRTTVPPSPVRLRGIATGPDAVVVSWRAPLYPRLTAFTLYTQLRGMVGHLNLHFTFGYSSLKCKDDDVECRCSVAGVAMTNVAIVSVVPDRMNFKEK